MADGSTQQEFHAREDQYRDACYTEKEPSSVRP
jgi:hypothetical protein